MPVPRIGGDGGCQLRAVHGRSTGTRGSTGRGRGPAGTCPPCRTSRRTIGLAPGSRAAGQPRRGRAPDAGRALHAAALETAAPPSVLVDESRQILHLSPSAGRFILHSAGTFSGKLPDVVRPELRLDLKIALDRALEKRLADA